jgi:glycogen(starch) synthase
MGMSLLSGKNGYGKEIFRSGEYVQYFKPEDRWNPFFRIYKQKKRDTINIINKTKSSKMILDVGGGMGRISLELVRSSHNNVVLTDISKDMLRMAAEQITDNMKLTFINADAHQLPFPDKSFDYIVGLDLLCHLAEPDKALHEFHRVLDDQGTLILDSTNSNPLWALFYPRYMGKNPLNWYRTMKFQGVLPGWEHIVNHYPRSKFLSLLQKSGFEVVQNLNYGPLICPKWHLAVSRKVIREN